MCTPEQVLQQMAAGEFYVDSLGRFHGMHLLHPGQEDVCLHNLLEHYPPSVFDVAAFGWTQAGANLESAQTKETLQALLAEIEAPLPVSARRCSAL